MNDFHTRPAKNWYDAEVTPRPTGSIETPYGTMTLECHENNTVHGTIAEPITLYRIPYKVAVEFRLDRRTEEWYVYSNSMRVKFVEPSYASDGKKWQTVTHNISDAARKAIRDAVTPSFEQWAEANYALIEQGKNIEVIRLIERGCFWCDDMVERLAGRRQWLARVRKELEEKGEMNENDHRLLREVWSWKL